MHYIRCVKSVRFRSYSDPHFPAFELNTERYVLFLCIQLESEKMQTRITKNTDSLHSDYQWGRWMVHWRGIINIVLLYICLFMNLLKVFRAVMYSLQYLSIYFLPPMIMSLEIFKVYFIFLVSKSLLKKSVTEP